MALFTGSKLLKDLKMSKIILKNYGSNKSRTVFSTMKENKKHGHVIKQINETIDDFLCQYKTCKEFPELGAYLKRATNYSMKRVEPLRYALTVNAYDMAKEPGHKTKETRKLAEITGICWELLFCTFLMSDDLEDGSLTRHHQPCWYTLPDVGVNVITDVVMIRGLQHGILKKWFDQHPQRWVIGEMFHEMYFETSVGQYLDKVTSEVKNEDYSNFTIKRWEQLINAKAGGSSFYAPVLSGLALTKRIDIEQISKLVKEICYRCAHITSMQNDFYDVYADFDVLRKDDTDIQEGKCTWLSVTALQRATPAQRSVFARNYGRAYADHVTKIKELYDDLQLQEVFTTSRNQMVDETKEIITRLPNDQLKNLMIDIVSCVSNDVA